MIEVSEVKAGTRLVADGGFTCLDEGQICEVYKDFDGDLYVNCKDEDRLHYLDGQLDDSNNYYVGFSLLKENAE